MKTSLNIPALFLTLMVLATDARAQGTAFTYHGRLNNNGAPVTGAYDMQFVVYDADAAGLLVAGPIPANAVGVANGLFTARIDFGAGVFTGPPRWLEISVRPAGNGNFTTLSPRQELTSSPYAIRAQSAGTAADVANGSVVKSLNNLRDNVSLAAGANVTITPNGNTLTIDSSSSSLWSLNGANAYYNGGNVGIGTTQPQGLLDLITGVSDTSALFVRADPGSYGRGGIMHHQSATYAWQELAQNTGGASDGYLTYHYVNRTAPGTKLASDVLTLRANGNVGIGTNNPQATLDVVGTIRSAGSISSGGPVSAAGRVDIATQDALRIRGYQPFVTMYDTSAFGQIFPPRHYIQVVGDNLHFLHQPECNVFPCITDNVTVNMTINGNGNVGIGTTTPQVALDVRGNLALDSGASPVLYTSTGDGEQNRYLQLINSPNSPSASGLKAGGILVADGYGYANPGKNDLVVKGKVAVGGDVFQARDRGGFVKAMIYVNADGTIARCYNGQTGSSTGNCGFTVNHDGVGNYNVLFGFQVTDRFASMTAHGYNGTFYYGPNVNGLLVYTYYIDGEGAVDCPFTLIVY